LTQPLISILIPTHNGKNNLIECINSISLTTYSNYEIIIIAADCNDGTADMINSDYPTIKLLEVGDYGWGESLNYGIINSQGEYVICLSDDYTVAPDWLSLLVDYLYEVKSVKIVGGKILFYESPEKVVSAGGKFGFFGTGGVTGFGNLDCEKYNQISETDFLPVPLIHKDVFKKVGLFDPKYFVSYDETDFCYRAKNEGYQIMYVPKAKLWHKIGGTTPPNSKRAYYQYHRNRLMFMLKNFSLPHLIISLPVIIGLYLYKIIKLNIKNDERSEVIISSIKWNVSNYRDILFARNNPQLQSISGLPSNLYEDLFC
jgi:GT2 family glycosyltransferase